MWKAPKRPDNEITQSFNDGLVTVYRLTDAAQPGYQPQPTMTPVTTLRFAELRLGIQRYYAAAQNQIQIERVIRVPNNGKISTQDVAVTNDGSHYRIDLIQTADGVYPPSVDLTLTRYTQRSNSDTGGEDA